MIDSRFIFCIWVHAFQAPLFARVEEAVPICAPRGCTTAKKAELGLECYLQRSRLPRTVPQSDSATSELYDELLPKHAGQELLAEVYKVRSARQEVPVSISKELQPLFQHSSTNEMSQKVCKLQTGYYSEAVDVLRCGCSIVPHRRGAPRAISYVLFLFHS